MALRLLPAIQQVFSNLGEVGTGFKLKTYQTLTLTPLATYSDEALTIPNANPASGATTGNQIADSAGRFGDMWVGSLADYKIILTDENDVTIDTVDPVGGTFSNILTAFNPIPEAFWGTTAGTSSAYTLDSNVDISGVGYQDTQIFEVDFHIENAANPTMAIDGLPALNLKKKTGQGTKVGLLAGDVNGTHLIRNDGTDLVVLNPRTQMLYLGAAPTITIAGGVATLTNVSSHYIIDGEGAAADTLDTINGLVDGQEVVIQIANAARPITFSVSGNILTQTGQSLVVSSTTTQIRIIYRSSDSKAIIQNYSYPLVYQSTGQTISVAGGLTLAHGLGARPDLVKTYVQCTTAELNYSIGDTVEVSCNANATATQDSIGFNTTFDTTNIVVRFGSHAAGTIILLNKTTGASAFITNGSWQFYVRAFLFT